MSMPMPLANPSGRAVLVGTASKEREAAIGANLRHKNLRVEAFKSTIDVMEKTTNSED